MALEYSLKAILNAVSHKGKKRMIYDHGALGGMKSLYLKLLFIAFPFIEYALIFNPSSFAFLGIAQAIIFYIVFLSVIMIIIFVMAMRNNKSLFRKIEPVWKNYFPDIELAMVLSSGVTPYKNFFTEYAKIVDDNLDDKALQSALNSAFNRMKEENRDLLEAIENARNR